MPDKNDMPDENLSSESEEDWKAKYEEVYEMLTETEAELKEFQVSSKELEDEMVLDIDRAEKAREEMQARLNRIEDERDDFKGKYLSLQSTHTTTVNSLQRELEALRESHRMIKIQLRDLEMGNDDLERHEREVVSSLEDLEQKYARALEEKILLEHELQDKASMEEDMQRLRDELRDSATEVAVLQDQLTKALASVPPPSPPIDDAIRAVSPSAASTADSLLEAPLPFDATANATMSEILEEGDTTIQTIRVSKFPPPSPRKIITSPASTSRIGALARSPASANSSTAYSPSRLPGPSPRRPLISASTTAPALPSSVAGMGRPTRLASAASSNSLVTRSKGMQMVSDMRSRVKVLEQRIQNRVPRMRKVSESGTAVPVSSSVSATAATGHAGVSSRTAGASGSAAAQMALKMQARDREREREKEKRASTATTVSTATTASSTATSTAASGSGEGDSPGWVLVTTNGDEFESASASSNRRTAVRTSRPVSRSTRDHVASPTSSSGAARHPVSSSSVAPPSAFRRSSHELTDHTPSAGGGAGLLSPTATGSSLASSVSGIRPPSSLGLRRSMGPSSDAYGLVASSSAASTTSSESSSTTGLRRSVSTKAGARSTTSTSSAASSAQPGRRSSLGASTALLSGGLGHSTAGGSSAGYNSGAAPRNVSLQRSSTLASSGYTSGSDHHSVSGSIRTARGGGGTGVPSRPGIPSMQPPTPPSAAPTGGGLGASSTHVPQPTRLAYPSRALSPGPSSSLGASMNSGIPPPRPRSNLGMAGKNSLMASSTNHQPGGGLGKSMIGRPTSLPLGASASANGSRVPRKSSAAGQ